MTCRSPRTRSPSSRSPASRSPLRWTGPALTLLLVLHGCASSQRTLEPGPLPETATVDPGAPEAGGADPAAGFPDDAPMPETPAVGDPVEETAAGPTAGPTAEEIDRAVREVLAGDPLGLVHEGENSRVFKLEMNERVRSWIHYFQTVIGERFGTYLDRKTRYEPMIRRKLREAGLPQDLIYLSLIESGMNPNAYSRASAVGLWQFIAGTGRRYGLEISYWVDERRDPEKATDAALRHLEDLYEEFGSWYLAMAAYNGGPNRIRRGLRRVPGATFRDLADRRLLPRETRDYVPKIIAAAIIGHDPAKYGFPDPVRQTRPEYVTVRVPDATSFDVLAEVAGTDEETINLLNAEFPRDVTPPNRQVEVRVPVEGADRFAVRYAAVPVDERVTWTFHTVQRGHTLGWIGEQYGVSVAALRAANGNINPRRLPIGQQLVVPRAARASGASIAQRSTARSTERTNAEGATVVTVQRGQTLDVIAQRYGVSVAALRAANGNVNPRRLQIGQDLLVPRAGRAAVAGPVTIVVRPGDSLWLIARRHSVLTSDLIEWNRLSSTRIHPGDRLEIRR